MSVIGRGNVCKFCEEKSITDAIKFANAFAGISTTRIGTANSMPSREEIEKLL